MSPARAAAGSRQPRPRPQKPGRAVVNGQGGSASAAAAARHSAAAGTRIRGLLRRLHRVGPAAATVRGGRAGMPAERRAPRPSGARAMPLLRSRPTSRGPRRRHCRRSSPVSHRESPREASVASCARARSLVLRPARHVVKSYRGGRDRRRSAHVRGATSTRLTTTTPTTRFGRRRCDLAAWGEERERAHARLSAHSPVRLIRVALRADTGEIHIADGHGAPPRGAGGGWVERA